MHSAPSPRTERGQILALFALSATVLVLAIGLVIDGGNALNERRMSQNTSDFAALAGARIIAQWIGGDATNGTDANVKAAITTTATANGADPITFGAPNGPVYIAANGGVTGYVGAGAPGSAPPANTVGVKVATSRLFKTYFLGIVGMGTFTASSDATARGGFAAGGPGGDVFPAGVALAFFQNYTLCSGRIGIDPGCDPVHLTPGSLNVPGGFGWLKFGAVGKCAGFGLGMSTTDGCREDKPFLQGEIGPPPNSYGCCTAVNGGPSTDANPIDRIGSLPGNKASADCSYYIDNKVTVTVPVWDYADSGGANGWYHIVGFAGFQLTACEGGKDIEGVWRRQIFQGPTTATAGSSFSQLAVQLIR